MRMSTIFNVTAVLTLILILVSCKKESSEQLSFQNISKANFSFLKSAQASNEANQLRSADYSALFEIAKVVRDKDLLTINVTYPDGCGDSKFEVIWNGLAMLPYPEIIFLYIRRTTLYIRRTTDCKVEGNSTSRVLSINLTECLGDAALAQRVKIILCNTSKKANTENSDIPVSSN